MNSQFLRQRFTLSQLLSHSSAIFRNSSGYRYTRVLATRSSLPLQSVATPTVSFQGFTPQTCRHEWRHGTLKACATSGASASRRFRAVRGEPPIRAADRRSKQGGSTSENLTAVPLVRLNTLFATGCKDLTGTPSPTTKPPVYWSNGTPEGSSVQRRPASRHPSPPYPRLPEVHRPCAQPSPPC